MKMKWNCAIEQYAGYREARSRINKQQRFSLVISNGTGIVKKGDWLTCLQLHLYYPVSQKTTKIAKIIRNNDYYQCMIGRASEEAERKLRIAVIMLMDDQPLIPSVLNKSLVYRAMTSFATTNLPFDPRHMESMFPSLDITFHYSPLVSYLDEFIASVARAKNITTATQYSEIPITDIEVYSWICLLILVLSGVMLGALPEILPCFISARSNESNMIAFKCNKYDGLSSMLRPSSVEADKEADNESLFAVLTKIEGEGKIGLVKTL